MPLDFNDFFKKLSLIFKVSVKTTRNRFRK